MLKSSYLSLTAKVVDVETAPAKTEEKETRGVGEETNQNIVELLVSQVTSHSQVTPVVKWGNKSNNISTTSQVRHQSLVQNLKYWIYTTSNEITKFHLAIIADNMFIKFQFLFSMIRLKVNHVKLCL